MEKIQLNSLKLSELEQFFLDINEKKYRARQLFEFLHKKKEFDLENITVFSKDLISKISYIAYVNTPNILRVYESALDNTKKFLIRLEDKNIIETVFMGYGDRNTLCISSQIGCKMGCSFCASTKAKFVRNLSVAEILSQIYLVENFLGENINNIVYMGIGEPLDNFETTVNSILILNDRFGKNLSQRSITVSTSGLVDKIYDLANLDLSINLAISLHYPFDEQRSLFMPINRKYGLFQLIEACEYYFDKTGRRVSYEYVLIEGLNDSDSHIDKLSKMFENKNIHINLIPLNEIEEFKYNSLRADKAKEFQKKLSKVGLNSTIRQKKGEDIEGACGQLRISYESGENI